VAEDGDGGLLMVTMVLVMAECDNFNLYLGKISTI